MVYPDSDINVKDTSVSFKLRSVKSGHLLISAAVVVSVFGIAFAQGSSKTASPKASVSQWEYKVMRINASGAGYSRVGRQYSSVGSEATGVPVSQEELNSLGAQGWDLVTSHLEMETSFPNFARGDTVEGLKSNVRPQALVMIFKRPTTRELMAEREETERRIRDKAARDAERATNEQKIKLESDKADRIQKETKWWDANRSKALLDGVIPDLTSVVQARILDAAPNSRLLAGGIITGIQLNGEASMRQVMKWDDILAALKENKGKTVLIRWIDDGDVFEFAVDAVPSAKPK